jgi:phage FluMu protein Com
MTKRKVCPHTKSTTLEFWSLTGHFILKFCPTCQTVKVITTETVTYSPKDFEDKWAEITKDVKE